jgi:hypothetical protein
MSLVYNCILSVSGYVAGNFSICIAATLAENAFSVHEFCRSVNTCIVRHFRVKWHSSRPVLFLNSTENTALKSQFWYLSMHAESHISFMNQCQRF